MIPWGYLKLSHTMKNSSCLYLFNVVNLVQTESHFRKHIYKRKDIQTAVAGVWESGFFQYGESMQHTNVVCLSLMVRLENKDSIRIRAEIKCVLILLKLSGTLNIIKMPIVFHRISDCKTLKAKRGRMQLM